jgi:hypothetical protein
MTSELEPERAPLPDWVLKEHPKPCRPRKRHLCRVCDEWVLPGEECVRWSGVTNGEGWWTCHAHPECYVETEDWDYEWDEQPGWDRPAVRMHWPKAGEEGA